MPNDTDNNENARIDREIETNQSLTRRFDGIALAQENSATQALIAKQTADIQARWIMAMKVPRNMHNVRQMIIKEIERPGFAEVAIYRVPRGGGTVKGLTIRTAEVMARCFGNLSVEAQTLFDSHEERVIRIGVTDFESNTSWTRDITVKKTKEVKQLKSGERAIRTRINSSGQPVHLVDAGDDDVAMKEASAISKASRTGILRLIPGHIQDEVFDRCDEIFEKKIEVDKDGQKNKMCDSFASLNVMPVELEKFLGHSIDTIAPVEIGELVTVFNAIKQGQATWNDALAAKIVQREQLKASRNGAPVPAKQSETKQATATATTLPTGKGNTAAKDKIKGATAANAPAPKTEEPKAEHTGPKLVKPEDDERDVVAAPDRVNYEQRLCADCGVSINVPKDDPPGAICIGCASVV